MALDFIPRGDGDLAQWASSYKLQIQAQAPALNLDARQVAAIVQSIDDFINSLDASNRLEDDYRAAVLVKDAQKVILVEQLRRQAASVKLNDRYTPAIGQVLGIIGAESPELDLDNLKPQPSISKTVQGVKIRYVKKRMDGVILYCRRGGESQFSQVEKYTRNVCEDRRPNLNGAAAELREYYLVYFKNDQAVGQASDIINITVAL